MNLTTLLQSDLSSPSAKGLVGSISSSASDKAGSSKLGFGQLMQPVSDITLGADTIQASRESESFDMTGLLDLLKQFGEDVGITVDQESGQITIDNGEQQSVFTLERNAGELSIELNGENIPLPQMLATLLKQVTSQESDLVLNGNANPQLVNKFNQFQQQMMRFEKVGSAQNQKISQNPTNDQNTLQQILQSTNSKTESAPLNPTLMSPELGKPQVKTAALDSNLVAVLNNTLTSNNVSSEGLQFKATVDNAKQSNLSELGQKLNNILADKISVQLSAKNQIATVRLDPPDLGKIDLTIKVENDKLQVQINASNQTTRESLNLTADKLRHELMGQNFLSVEVSIQQENNNSASETFAFHEDEVIRSSFNDNDASSPDNHRDLINEKELARA